METLVLLLAHHLSDSHFEMVLKGTTELSASIPPIEYRALLVLVPHPIRQMIGRRGQCCLHVRVCPGVCWELGDKGTTEWSDWGSLITYRACRA